MLVLYQAVLSRIMDITYFFIDNSEIVAATPATEFNSDDKHEHINEMLIQI